MTYPSFEQLLRRAWPADPNRNVNNALDEHETHYGLNLTEADILKGIGQ